MAKLPVGRLFVLISAFHQFGQNMHALGLIGEAVNLAGPKNHVFSVVPAFC